MNCSQIGSLNNLEVPPTPYTLKFSAIEGLEPLPDLPASFMARNAPDIKQQLPLHPYIRRPYAIPEPELSPRTLMRQRLKETVRCVEAGTSSFQRCAVARMECVHAVSHQGTRTSYDARHLPSLTSRSPHGAG